MDNKYAVNIEKIKDFIKSKDKIKLLVLIGIIGIVMILLSEIVVTDESDKITNTCSNELSFDYVSQLEEKTVDIISSIDGVGQCKVMLTVKESSESVYAQNIDEQSKQGYYCENNEYVLYESSDGETPVLIKQNYPQIQGVVIVCEGGDNISVKEQIIDCITSLYNISSTNISVSKLNQKR